jgi:hypothetical protein
MTQVNTEKPGPRAKSVELQARIRHAAKPLELIAIEPEPKPLKLIASNRNQACCR